MESQEGNPTTKVAIAAHPLFPPMVAVWFAALFGLGCLVLPASLLEKAARALPTAGQLPASLISPLFALLTGALAGLAGFVLARKLASRPQSHNDAIVPPRKSMADVPQRRRPISAREELDPEWDKVTQEEVRADGTSVSSPEVEEIAVDSWFEDDGDFIELVAEAPDISTEPTFAPALNEAEPDTAEFTEVAAEDLSAPRKPRRPFPRPIHPRGHFSTAPLEQLGMVELAERLGLALSRLIDQRDSEVVPAALTAANVFDEVQVGDHVDHWEEADASIASPPAGLHQFAPLLATGFTVETPEEADLHAPVPIRRETQNDDLRCSDATEKALQDALETLRRFRGAA